MADKQDQSLLSAVYCYLKETCSDAATVFKKKLGVVRLSSIIKEPRALLDTHYSVVFHMVMPVHTTCDLVPTSGKF